MPFPLVSLKGSNVKLESADWNQLDEDHTKTINAVDGDQVSPTNPVEFIGGIVRFKTAGVLAVGDSGEAVIEEDGILTVEADGSIELEAGGGILANVGSVINMSGVQAINGTLVVNATENIANGGEFNVESGGVATVESGGIIRLEGTTVPTYLSPSARTFTRTACHLALYDQSVWDAGPFAAPTNGYYVSTSNAGNSGDRIVFAIDPPDGSTITAISVWTDPPGGHVGDPAEKTRLRLYEQNVATGAAITEVFDLADPDTVAGTYQSAHAITQSGLSVTVDKSTKTYFVIVVPENDTNSIVGTKIWPPRFTFTRAKLGEE